MHSDLTYDLRSGDPDALDQIVATTFANIAVDLIADGHYRPDGGRPRRQLRPRAAARAFARRAARSTSRRCTTSSATGRATRPSSDRRCCWGRRSWIDRSDRDRRLSRRSARMGTCDGSSRSTAAACAASSRPRCWPRSSELPGGPRATRSTSWPAPRPVRSSPRPSPPDPGLAARLHLRGALRRGVPPHPAARCAAPAARRRPVRRPGPQRAHPRRARGRAGLAPERRAGRPPDHCQAPHRRHAVVLRPRQPGQLVPGRVGPPLRCGHCFGGRAHLLPAVADRRRSASWSTGASAWRATRSTRPASRPSTTPMPTSRRTRSSSAWAPASCWRARGRRGSAAGSAGCSPSCCARRRSSRRSSCTGTGRRPRFYRLDLALERDIGLDAVDRVGELRALGERLASAVDWPAILDGRDARYLVTDAPPCRASTAASVPAEAGTSAPCPHGGRGVAWHACRRPRGGAQP